MKSLLLPTITLLVLAGCRDLPRETPTEPAPEEAAATAAPSDGKADASTLCAAYRRELAASRASLAREPGNVALQETVETFTVVIADACN